DGRIGVLVDDEALGLIGPGDEQLLSTLLDEVEDSHGPKDRRSCRPGFTTMAGAMAEPAEQKDAKAQRFKCEACGAEQRYDASLGKLKCDFCGATRAVPESA